jgi:hypothetical protein
MGLSQVVVPIENGVLCACGRVDDAGGASWLWKRVFIARRDKIRARGWCSLSTIIFLQAVAATPCTASQTPVLGIIARQGGGKSDRGYWRCQKHRGE